MIEPLDFTKYEVADFPHSLHYHKDNYASAIEEWHQINDFITEEFKADLVVYLIDCLADLGEESIYLPKIIKLIEISMENGIEYYEVVNLCVRMLPLWQLTGDNPYSERYNMYTRESVVQECIDVIMNSGDRHRKEYFAGLLKEHFGVK